MIPIGQYIRLASPIHELDPRTKLIGLVILATLILLAKDLTHTVILLLFLWAILLLSKLPHGLVLKGLKGFLFIFLFTILIHLFFGSGEEVSLGLYKGVFIILQLTGLILGAMVLTGTTSPLRLVDGLRWIFAPLKSIGVPVGELALIVVIALRFIPTLILEAERLIKAQKARGIEFERGPIRTRIKNSISIIVPLFVNAMGRAEDLAQAMETRCFKGVEGRSHLRKLCFKEKDLVALSVLALLALVMYKL